MTDTYTSKSLTVEYKHFYKKVFGILNDQYKHWYKHFLGIIVDRIKLILDNALI